MLYTFELLKQRSGAEQAVLDVEQFIASIFIFNSKYSFFDFIICTFHFNAKALIKLRFIVSFQLS